MAANGSTSIFQSPDALMLHGQFGLMARVKVTLTWQQRPQPGPERRLFYNDRPLPTRRRPPTARWIVSMLDVAAVNNAARSRRVQAAAIRSGPPFRHLPTPSSVSAVGPVS
jgi:hypothetical protein